ncbi:MAG: hypothetical protein AB1801_22550, partial [Chloroflexota bacterium]
MKTRNLISSLIAIVMLIAILSYQNISPSRAQACPSIPSGGTITFLSNRGGSQELYAIDGSECNIHQLTHDGGSASSAAWSPDGTKVAYSSNGILYVMNADGSNRHQLLSSAPAGSQHSPDWSPDGSK